jgi:hypothetical protein
MKKILFLVGLVLLAGGCSNNQFVDSYNKMQVADDTINGYSLDLRIFGSVETERINQIVKIDNYNNKDYKITKVNAEANIDENIGMIQGSENIGIIEGNESQQEEVIYAIGGKTYALDKDGKYSETKEPITFNNPAIYLNGLKNVSEASDPLEEKIGDETYNVYNVTFAKADIEDIIKDTGIKNITLENNVTGKIYLNENGYVYRVIYNINDLTINANYSGINTASEITLPVANEIENPIMQPNIMQ